jgi:tRNA A-37 threonylcarbamoyl transferase component Bud32/membrane-associated phospholipid phosphatase
MGLLIVMALLLWGLLSSSEMFFARGRWWDDLDAELLDWVVGIRSGALTDIARVINSLTNEVFLSIIRWAAIAAMLAHKRWRHLGVFVVVILSTEIIAAGLTRRLARVRPDEIEILIDWTGFSFPSVPYVAFTLTLIAMMYSLAVPGRPRRIALYTVSALIVLVGLSRLYLGGERATDLLGGGIIAVAFPVLVFRFAVPDAVFPVNYSRTKTAHLDITGIRGAAILRALSDQLGLAAESIELFGTEGSGGSTPLRVRLEDGSHVFAKLYAQNHLRSDRWYKLGRSLLYGALEDEAPFRTVRRLAEHEDHMMRLMGAAGVPIAEPRGVLEITPGREYLIVTDFIDGASEIDDAVVDETTIRAGLTAVRAMWDAGLAHRDIKPANLLVAGGEVYFIDHAFGEIRPSPWREAADLANMMMTLSLVAPADQIHRVAGEIFTADEIGEAFAVARSVTIPGELRQAMREHPTDVLVENRSLAPARPPIGIQRWTPRRLFALGAAVVLAISIARLVMLNRTIAGELL